MKGYQVHVTCLVLQLNVRIGLNPRLSCLLAHVANSSLFLDARLLKGGNLLIIFWQVIRRIGGLLLRAPKTTSNKLALARAHMVRRMGKLLSKLMEGIGNMMRKQKRNDLKA
jgi:hypothetical protein